MERPRLLLVPEFTEVEWAIRPQLEEWAEVASYDPPGVGDEPRAERVDREVVVQRGLRELERRGWDRCFIGADSYAIASAARIALERPDSVQGLALGHAKLSYRREGERAPVSGEIWAAMTEFIQKDHEGFLRNAIVQATGGSIDEARANEMIERLPSDPDFVVQAWLAATKDDVDIGELLRELDRPLLLAQHVGCLGSTEEGYEDAVRAFPEARQVACNEAPLTSDEFAAALREFCLEVTAGEFG